MSDYTKGTNFAAKDALLTGDANKVVSGTEIDDEFALARVAINSKADETGGILNDCDINNPDLDGGAIDGCTIGSSSPVTTLTVDNINVNGNTISSTDTNGNIAITPNGTGEVDISKVDIDSGTIDGTTIGGSSAAVVTATTLNATDVAVDTNVLVVDGTTNNNVGIGTATPDASYKLDVSGDVRATEFHGGGSNLTGINTGFIFVDAGALSGLDQKEVTLVDTDISELIIMVIGASVDVGGAFLLTNFSTSSGYITDTSKINGYMIRHDYYYNGVTNVREIQYSGGLNSTLTIGRFDSASSILGAKLHAVFPAAGKAVLQGGYSTSDDSGTFNGWINETSAITKFKITSGETFDAGNLYYGYRKNAI